jgi:hypothetical protein
VCVVCVRVVYVCVCVVCVYVFISNRYTREKYLAVLTCSMNNDFLSN